MQNTLVNAVHNSIETTQEIFEVTKERYIKLILGNISL